MRQFHAAKARYPRHLLFFRMGDFFELFHEDAKVASRVLGLTLTSRNKGPEAIPMAGVPVHSAEGYLARLLRQGFSVAICDQVEDAKLAKGLVKRAITRVVTPGTVVEEKMLDARKPNRLVALCPGEAGGGGAGAESEKRTYGLASADLASGEILVRECPGAGALLSELARLDPSECLLPEAPPPPPGARPEEPLPPGAKGRFARSLLKPAAFEPREAHGRLRGRFGSAAAASIEDLIGELPLAAAAAGALIGYIEEMHGGAAPHLRPPRRLDLQGFLELDEVAIRSLELVETLRERAFEGSLLWTLDRTCSGAGARCLREWLLRPLRDLAALQARQEAVATLAGDIQLREEVRAELKKMADLERIAARLSAGRATPRDLLALKNSLHLLPRFENALDGLRGAVLAAVRQRLTGLGPVAERIASTLKDDCPNTLSEGGLIRDGVHAELDRLREIARGGKRWIANFQAGEQKRSGIPGLKVGYNRVFGYYIEITKAHARRVPEDYERRQTLTHAERYVTPALKEREAEVLGAEEKIHALEARLFVELREEIARSVGGLQQAGAGLAELDALGSLAEVAFRKGHVRPELSESRRLRFEQLCHPVLAAARAKGEVVPNDLALEAGRGRSGASDTPQVLLLTGPNMAGKSTYIRAAALGTILAQMGAFVPAEKAEVGLVDRIFTRVGAADDISGGRSTFMVEMAEVAAILAHATDDSLVILDEVGRGTSTYDGVSLAWALVEHLHNGPARPRTLFATHYHELCQLEEALPRLKNANALVKEWQGEITFLYRIAAGPSEKSFGLHVARLAGLPKEVIERARTVLRELEDEAEDRIHNITTEGGASIVSGRPAGSAPRRRLRRKPSAFDGQLQLFEPRAAEIEPRVKALLDELRGTNAERLTPLEALGKLDELAKKAKGEK